MKTPLLKLASIAFFKTTGILTILGIIILIGSQPAIESHPVKTAIIAVSILIGIHQTFILGLLSKNMADINSISVTHIKNRKLLNHSNMYSITTMTTMTLSLLLTFLTKKHFSFEILSATNLIYLLITITVTSLLLVTINKKYK